MTDPISKYDRLSERFAEKSYANLEFYMHHRFVLTVTWGTPLQRGDAILELGCGDGYLAQLFVQNGFHYCGVDISPKMVEAANQRLQAAGLSGKFLVADVNQLALSEPYDAVIAYMRTFFAYVRDPLIVLRKLRPFVRKKIIVDLNPRQDISLADGIAMLQAAGFRRITWRSFFVPKEKRLPDWVLKTMIACEGIPLVRSIPLRWKFHCLLKGEP